jgi:general secretion pathway protein F
MVISHLLIDGRDEADARRQVEARGLFVSAITPAAAAWCGVAAGAARCRWCCSARSCWRCSTPASASSKGWKRCWKRKPTRHARRAGTPAGRPARGPALFRRAGRQPDLFRRCTSASSRRPRAPPTCRALARYIDYQQRIDLVRAKLVSAAIYPCILLLVGGGVSLFLIGYVVPRLPSVPGRRPQPAVAVAADAELGPVRRRPCHAAAGRRLPPRWPRWRSACAACWPMAAGAPAGKLPGIGERVRIYELSRLYLTLGMLSEGGITIVHAIDTVQGMVSPACAATAGGRAEVGGGPAAVDRLRTPA